MQTFYLLQKARPSGNMFIYFSILIKFIQVHWGKTDFCFPLVKLMIFCIFYTKIKCVTFLICKKICGSTPLSMFCTMKQPKNGSSYYFHNILYVPTIDTDSKNEKKQYGKILN